MATTYVKVNGEISKYSHSTRKSKPRCLNCHSSMVKISCRKVKGINELTVIGYYCQFCEQGYMDKSCGKFFKVEVVN